MCLENLSETPSDSWLEPLSVPQFCVGSLVQFLPLGKDDRMRFSGMLVEIWSRIKEFREGALPPLPEHIKTLEVCCKRIGQAVLKYSALTEGEKQRAEVQLLPHLKSDRRFEVQLMRYDESRTARRLAKSGSQEEFSESEQPFQEQAVGTVCGHRFGMDCLGTWLEMHGTCPMCREQLIPRMPRMARLPIPAMWAYNQRQRGGLHWHFHV